MFIGPRVMVAGLAAAKRADGARCLEELIAQHTEARGGAAALDAVTSVLKIAHITETTVDVIGRYIASKQGFVRIDVYCNGERTLSEGIDCEGGWEWPSNTAEPRPASAVARAFGALAHGIVFNLYGLHAMARHGHTPSLEGREKIEGVNYYKLRLRLADGFDLWRHIHPETWMIDRDRHVCALCPEKDLTLSTIETAYMEFRRVRGVVTPFRWVQRNDSTGEEMQIGNVQRLEYNPPAAALNFSRTAALIAP